MIQRFTLIAAVVLVLHRLAFADTTPSGPQLIPQVGDDLPAVCAAYSPDGRFLVTGYADSNIKIWAMPSGILVRTLRGPGFPISSLAVSPDGKSIISGSGWSLDSYNLTTGQFQWSRAACLLAAYVAGGQKIVCSDGLYMFVVNSLYGGRISSWKPPVPVTITAMAMEADGVHLIVGGETADRTQGIAWVFDIRSGELVDTLDAELTNIEAITCSSDGSRFAVGGAGGPVCLFDPMTDRKVAAFDAGRGGSVLSLAFSPDSQTLLAGTDMNETMGFAVGSGRSLGVQALADSPVQSIAYSPDGGSFFLGCDDNGTWNAQSHQKQLVLPRYARSIADLSFSPDGRYLLAGVAFSALEIWDTSNRALARTVRNGDLNPADAVWSPDSSMVFDESIYDGSVLGWFVASGAETSVLRGDLVSQTASPAFTPGTKLAFAHSKTVVIADKYLGLQRLDLAVKPMPVALGGSGPDETALSVSPDRSLLAAGSGDNLQVWGTGDWKLLWQTKEPEAQAASSEHIVIVGKPRNNVNRIIQTAFSPDGGSLACLETPANSVTIYRAVDGTLLTRFSVRSAPTGAPFQGGRIAYVPATSTLAVCDSTGTISFFDTQTGALERTLTTGQEQYSFAVSPSGDTFAIGGRDQDVRLYDRSTGALDATLVTIPGPPDRDAVDPSLSALDPWMAYTPDGYYDCSPDAAHYIDWTVGEQVYPAATFQQKYHRPDLLAASVNAPKTTP